MAECATCSKWRLRPGFRLFGTLRVPLYSSGGGVGCDRWRVRNVTDIALRAAPDL
jgi:hypothetical protein